MSDQGEGRRSVLDWLSEIFSGEPTDRVELRETLRDAADRQLMDGEELNIIFGALQVSEHGDLANWSTGAPDAIPAVGGAMDLVAGVKTIFVITQHVTRDGQPKLVQQCTYPLTSPAVVDRIYTNLAVIDVTERGFQLVELARERVPVAVHVG